MYYLLTSNLAERQRIIRDLAAEGIGAVFHYVPLHDSPAGVKFGRAPSPLPVTNTTSERLLRLPIWAGLEPHLDEVIGSVRTSVLRKARV
jgi:dTDP-4-amino-4,6-dideoxygalactose transaminase